MTVEMLLRIAAELRERAAAADDPARAELLFLAGEYEESARAGHADTIGAFSVRIPK